jgi:hypothetical protein
MVKSIRLFYQYIVKSIKNQKGKPCEMDLPLLKNDITSSEPISKLGIHSRNQANNLALEIATF